MSVRSIRGMVISLIIVFLVLFSREYKPLECGETGIKCVCSSCSISTADIGEILENLVVDNDIVYLSEEYAYTSSKGFISKSSNVTVRPFHSETVVVTDSGVPKELPYGTTGDTHCALEDNFQSCFFKVVHPNWSFEGHKGELMFELGVFSTMFYAKDDISFLSVEINLFGTTVEDCRNNPSQYCDYVNIAAFAIWLSTGHLTVRNTKIASYIPAQYLVTFGHMPEFFAFSIHDNNKPRRKIIVEDCYIYLYGAVLDALTNYYDVYFTNNYFEITKDVTPFIANSIPYLMFQNNIVVLTLEFEQQIGGSDANIILFSGDPDGDGHEHHNATIQNNHFECKDFLRQGIIKIAAEKYKPEKFFVINNFFRGCEGSYILQDNYNKDYSLAVCKPYGGNCTIRYNYADSGVFFEYFDGQTDNWISEDNVIFQDILLVDGNSAKPDPYYFPGEEYLGVLYEGISPLFDFAGNPRGKKDVGISAGPFEFYSKCDPPCNPKHGYCLLNESRCVCYPPFRGPTCDDCPPGWEGDECDIPICIPKCVNGYCAAVNVCVCYPSFMWTGEDCNTTLCLPPCLEGECAVPLTCPCNYEYELGDFEVINTEGHEFYYEEETKSVVYSVTYQNFDSNIQVSLGGTTENDDCVYKEFDNVKFNTGYFTDRLNWNVDSSGICERKVELRIPLVEYGYCSGIDYLNLNDDSKENIILTSHMETHIEAKKEVLSPQGFYYKVITYEQDLDKNMVLVVNKYVDGSLEVVGSSAKDGISIRREIGPRTVLLGPGTIGTLNFLIYTVISVQFPVGGIYDYQTVVFDRIDPAPTHPAPTQSNVVLTYADTVHNRYEYRLETLTDCVQFSPNQFNLVFIAENSIEGSHDELVFDEIKYGFQSKC